MILSFKEKPLQAASETSTEPLQGEKDNDKDLSMLVSKEVSKAIYGRGWMLKASRNIEALNPYRLVCDICPFIGVVVVCLGIAYKHTPLEIFIYCLITAALFIGLNPMDIISRFLARQTRFFLVTDIIICSCSFPVGSIEIILAASLWTFTTLLLCFFMNTKWLIAYNWRNTEAVVSALVESPDNMALKAWNDHGKTECRTVLVQLGLPFKEEVLDLMAKPLFMIGHHYAWRSTNNDVEAREKAEKAMESMKESMESMAEDVDVMKAERKIETERYNEAVNNLRVDKATFDFYVKGYNSMKKKVEDLEAVNLQLVAGEDVEEKDEKQIIRSKIASMRKRIDPETGNPTSYGKIHKALTADGHKIGASTVAKIGREIENEEEKAS